LLHKHLKVKCCHYQCQHVPTKKSILPLQIIIFFFLPKDPTGICQKQIQQVLQKCNVLFDKHKITYLLQINPSPPKLNAQLKIHKDDIPIYPVVNYRNLPAYKLAQFLQKLLSEHLNIPNEFITPNSVVLVNTLTDLNIMDEYRYYTLRKQPLTLITQKMLKQEILQTLYIILNQNYFQFNDSFDKPATGVAMGLPLSGLIVEVFLQYCENVLLRHAIENKHIFYTPYF